ncbi:hypothetical protein CI610_03294 [invertebrate metagenome]|uniref:Uncharacterized protein n=1 Tax=invertebrate metagenome TaxID=1711999 RepID=A0A2H9T3L1_9ZZZZ
MVIGFKLILTYKQVDILPELNISFPGSLVLIMNQVLKINTSLHL